MHIAILNTCNDTEDYVKAFPDDGQRFVNIMRPHRPDWRYAVLPVIENVFPEHVDDYDGYVITGSPASVNGSEPWIARLLDFIRALDAAKKPTVGCCFGHQAIAKALGGRVERAASWGLGISPTHYARHESWMTPACPTLNLYSAHAEQVTALPAGAAVLGGSDHCPVGSYRIGDHFFTTEFHPEMPPEFIAALVAFLEKHLDAETIAKAREELQSAADGALFARWMVQFLEMKRQGATIG